MNEWILNFTGYQNFTLYVVYLFPTKYTKFHFCLTIKMFYVAPLTHGPSWSREALNVWIIPGSLPEWHKRKGHNLVCAKFAFWSPINNGKWRKELEHNCMKGGSFFLSSTPLSPNGYRTRRKKTIHPLAHIQLRNRHVWRQSHLRIGAILLFWFRGLCRTINSKYLPLITVIHTSIE